MLKVVIIIVAQSRIGSEPWIEPIETVQSGKDEQRLVIFAALEVIDGNAKVFGILLCRCRPKLDIDKLTKPINKMMNCLNLKITFLLITLYKSQ